MLLTHDIVSTITRRNQLDLEAISDGYKSSKSVSWLREQVSFLSRMAASLTEMIAKSDEPIGPLHALRVQHKVVLSLGITIARKLTTLQSQNARRSARQNAKHKFNREMAEGLRALLKQQQEPAQQIAVAKPDVNVLLAQLGTYDPLAPKAERDAVIGGGIDSATSKRQADELDAIFGIKPEEL